MRALAGYWPISSARGLVIYKNGQLYESSVTLDFMLLTEAQSQKFSELLDNNTGLSTDVSNIGFWADGHLPTNPIFTAANLSTGLTLGSRVSSLCFSDFIKQLIPNVGDEIMIKSVEAGSAYGFGFKTRQIVDSRRIAVSFEFDDNGTRRTTNPGQILIIGEAGSGSSLEYWRFFFGVVMDRNNEKAYPFVVHGYYTLPYGNYDTMRLKAPYFSSSVFESCKRVAYAVFSNQPPEPTPDPYPSDNYDEPIVGPGDFDDTSDTIDMPTTPTLTIGTSQLVNIYVPNSQQIEDLAGRLIDPSIFEALANTVEDVSACVIGLHIIPVNVPFIVPDRQLCMNFIGITIKMGLYMNKPVKQFIDVDCGTLVANEYWGNCLDYSPYTRISIFLPFCGYYDLDTDEVMGKSIQVKYRVDIASGSCIAFIVVNGSVLYQYTGNCAQQIPLTAVDFNSFLSNAFNVAVSTATGKAGISAAGAAVMAADAAFGGSTGSNVEERSDMLEATTKHYEAVKMRAEGRIAGAAVNAVVNSKPHFNHGGSLSGSSGFLGCKKPYLIITRPNPMIPDMYGKFHGYPCNTTAKLDDLLGYTEVADIRLNIPDATIDEIIECEKLLKDGVVI